MVRAGRISHPSEWGWSSFDELCGGRRRYRLIDMETLLRKIGYGGKEEFSSWYRKTLDDFCARCESLKREPWWSEAKIAGDKEFISSIIERGKRKHIVSSDDTTFYVC